MTSLRDDLESAYWEHWRKALRDNPRDGLPAYLNRLEEIYREREPEPVSVKREDDAPTDEQVAAWIEANPQKFEAWVRKQQRVLGEPPIAPAKPATRRRTRT